jgi:hypothetical protein
MQRPLFSTVWCILGVDAEHAPLPDFPGKFCALYNVISYGCVTLGFIEG